MVLGGLALLFSSTHCPSIHCTVCFFCGFFLTPGSILECAIGKEEGPSPQLTTGLRNSTAKSVIKRDISKQCAVQKRNKEENRMQDRMLNNNVLIIARGRSDTTNESS